MQHMQTCIKNQVLAVGLQGRGWEPGQVRAKLQELVEKHSDVPKAPAYTYSGAQIGKFHSPRKKTRPNPLLDAYMFWEAIAAFDKRFPAGANAASGPFMSPESLQLRSSYS